MIHKPRVLQGFQRCDPLLGVFHAHLLHQGDRVQGHMLPVLFLEVEPARLVDQQDIFLVLARKRHAATETSQLGIIYEWLTTCRE